MDAKIVKISKAMETFEKAARAQIKTNDDNFIK